eukprot:4816169-Amphidinium_carterae.2
MAMEIRGLEEGEKQDSDWPSVPFLSQRVVPQGALASYTPQGAPYLGCCKNIDSKGEALREEATEDGNEAALS